VKRRVRKSKQYPKSMFIVKTSLSEKFQTQLIVSRLTPLDKDEGKIVPVLN